MRNIIGILNREVSVAMKRGFTLIELVMVITILGILAVVAIPKFIDLRDDAKARAEDGVEAAIEAGAQIYKAQELIDGNAGTYPATLNICLDDDTTADIFAAFTIAYTSGTGQAEVTHK